MTDKSDPVRRWGPIEFSPRITLADLLAITMASIALVYAFAGLDARQQRQGDRIEAIEKRQDSFEARALENERRYLDKLEVINSKLDQLLGREQARRLGG